MPREPGKLRFSRSAAPPTLDVLYERAVRALATRGRSEAEMRRWLATRRARPEDSNEVMARLRDHGYLDDKRMAESFTQFRKDVSAHGRERVLRDLRARGVDSATATDAVQRGYEGSNEDAQLAAFLRKSRARRPENVRQAGSLYRRWRLAGFSSPACMRALRRFKADAEWLEVLENSEAPEAADENSDD